MGCVLSTSILIVLVFLITASQAVEPEQIEGDFLDQITIPATGAIVESNLVLVSDVRYVIVVTGTYRYDVGEPGEFADAQYREDDNDQWTIQWNSVEFDGIRLTANVFDVEHHAYTFYITGQGQRMTFRIYDDSGAYGDNEGSLTATIAAVGHSPGWYSPGSPLGGAALIHDDISGLRIVWGNSYIYQNPGTDNLYWYAQVIYINDGNQILQINCSEQADRSLFKEHIRGAEGLPHGTSGYVPADETFCSRNPSTIVSIGPGEGFYDWAIFPEVPRPGDEVSLEWGSYGSSPGVNPWYRPYPPDVPPPAECPPELVTLGTCQPGPRPIMTTHLSTEPDGKAPNLVVLVHGCCTDANGVSEWDQLADKIVEEIIKNNIPIAWEIVVWDWHEHTPNDCFNLLDCANEAYDAAYDHDGKLGQSGYIADAINAYSTYKYIHFIAHSAGAKLIDEAAKTLAGYKNQEGGERPFIHLTFLDAYTRTDKDSGVQDGKGYGYLENYPKDKHYAEHYVDRGLPSTDACLASAFNFDITGWEHSTDLASDPFDHQWPRHWYKESITSTSPEFKYGYPLSLEGNSKDINELVDELANYSVGQQCYIDTDRYTNCQPAVCWQ